MHQTTVNRYVRAHQDIWRVVCAQCGVLADHLGAYEAGRTEKMLARQACSSDSVAQARASDSTHGTLDTNASDARLLALWTGQDVGAGSASRAW